MTPSPEAPARLSEAELKQIAERAEKATPGPWEVHKLSFDGSKYPAVVSPAGDAELGNWVVAERVRRERDAAYIAAAHPAAVLALIERVRRCDGTLAQLYGVVNHHNCESNPAKKLQIIDAILLRELAALPAAPRAAEKE